MAETNPKIDGLKARWEADPTSRVFAQLAEEYRKAGMPDECIEVSLEGLKAKPGHHSARVTLARAYSEKGNSAAAIHELEIVLEASGANLLANRLLADIYFEQKDWGRAHSRYEHILGLNPFEDGVQERIDTCREALPDIEDAEPEPEAKDETTQTRQVHVPQAMIKAHQHEDAASKTATISKDDLPPLTASPPPPPTATQTDLPDAVAPAGVSETDFSDVVAEMNADLSGPAGEQAQDKDASDTRPGEESVMTSETLAGLYETQGLTEKALRLYENLLLRDPENATYLEKVDTLKGGNGRDAVAPPPEPVLAVRSPEMQAQLQADIQSLSDPHRAEKVKRLRLWLDAIHKEKQGT